MTLAELSETLPNGFHDASVLRLQIDYAAREAVFDVSVWIGNLDSDDLETREMYRAGRLTLTGLVYCVIEPPDSRYPYQEGAGITIDTGTMAALPKPPAGKLPNDAAGAFTNWIFVREWNAFMYVAAMDASLQWLTANEPPASPNI